MMAEGGSAVTLRLLLILALMGLTPACDSDDPEPDGGDADADADVDGDADGDLDGDLDEGDADEPEGGIAPIVEPEPLQVEAWMIGLLPNPNSDPIRSSVEDGTFAIPEEGTDDNGITWRLIETGENGSLGYVGRTIGYAAAILTRDEPTRIVTRLDFATGVYTNGVLQPGDLYGSRKSRIPMMLEEGDNLVIVRTYGWRGNTEAELFTTPDELHFNMNDLTVPDLVVGDETEKWLGVPILNITEGALLDVTARVVGDDDFEETEVVYPAFGPLSVTQVGFQLVPRTPPAEAEEAVTIVVQLQSPSLQYIYEREIELSTVADDVAYRRTFQSPTDGSVQYYGVQPPSDLDSPDSYALVLSLHGAGVQGAGQARSYSQRDWNYVIAPTNRRPFGFDWEEWGRLNGLNALHHAQSVFDIDLERVYLTGHSMGGHGTWHLGVHDTANFAVIAPSAGWSSFYSYTGDTRPTGSFGRARAHSDTNNYLGNLSNRGVYIIHGSADDNVPVREGRAMSEAVGEITDDLVYHEEPGAGHWWDGDEAPGADCVDWLPLFDFMRERTVDPYELDFVFISPGAWYSSQHSYVRLWASESPMEDLLVESMQVDETTVELITDNVRTFELDGAVLSDLGIEQVLVDGVEHAVTDDSMIFGSDEGKRYDLHGPYNQVYHRPFCWVYPDGEEGALFAQHAAYLTSYWSIYGNGQACSLPLGQVTDELREERNLIYVGIPMEEIDLPDIPFEWDADGVTVDGSSYDDAAMMFVFPEGDRLSAVLTAAEGVEWLLYWIVPFSSRAGLPDYLVWSYAGGQASGFFDADWEYVP